MKDEAIDVFLLGESRLEKNIIHGKRSLLGEDFKEIESF
jgi:hypothetical protein